MKLDPQQLDECTRHSLWRAYLPAAVEVERADDDSNQRVVSVVSRAAGAFDALARVRHAAGLPGLDRAAYWRAARIRAREIIAKKEGRASCRGTTGHGPKP